MSGDGSVLTHQPGWCAHRFTCAPKEKDAYDGAKDDGKFLKGEEAGRQKHEMFTSLPFKLFKRHFILFRA